MLDDDMENDPGDSFFSLGEPLMTWDISESVHPKFSVWAYSILKPTLEIETRNQRLAPTGRFEKLIGKMYSFSDRDNNDLAVKPPTSEIVEYQYSPNHELIYSNVRSSLIPFAFSISNKYNGENRTQDFEQLVSILLKFGVEADQPNELNRIIKEMREDEKMK